MQPIRIAELRQLPRMKSRASKSAGRVRSAILFALTGLMTAGLTSETLAKPGEVSLDVAPQTSRAAARAPRLAFDLVTSTAAAACLPNARGAARLTTRGQNQHLDVFVSGLPPHDTFTVFVLQLPHAPFGFARYQGDIETDEDGSGHAQFDGIFSDETFVVAPNVGPAPVVDPSDANANPQTAPVHMFHLGVWFDSTTEARGAGCPVGRTPFNGDHTAGIQVLNTADFPDGDGPIGQFGR